MIERRTYDGMVGYVEGYTACYRQFVNYLEKYGADRARLKMEMLVMVVEDVLIEPKEQTDCAWK